MEQGHINQKFCAEIRVPTTEKNNNKTIYEFSSGYAIGDNLILTCEHGLFPENRDESDSLLITWRDDKGISKDAEPVSRAKICWRSKKFDIALIECSCPNRQASINNRDLISPRKVNHNDSWHSLGFLGLKQDIRGEKDFQTPEGRLVKTADNNEFIKVSVSEHGVENQEQWGGFCGSPVFSGDKIIGVVKATNTKDSLTVMIINAAMESVGDGSQKTLKEALKWPAQDHRELRQKNQFKAMVKAIENNKEAKQALCDMLQFCHSIQTEGVVKEFNKLDDETAIDYLTNAFRTLKEEHKDDAVIAIGIFAENWSPVRLGLSLEEIDQLRTYIVDPLKAPVDMPNCIKMVDEIIMSELDKGPLAFCFDEESILSSKYNLGNFAEMGMDEDGEQLSEEMEELLKKKFNKIDQIKDFEHKLDKHAYYIAKKNDSLGTVDNNDETNKTAVANILSNLFKLNGRRYFCRVNKQLDNSVYIDKKKIYQALVFITHNDNNANKDDNCYGLLSMIIAQAKKLKETNNDKNS